MVNCDYIQLYYNYMYYIQLYTSNKYDYSGYLEIKFLCEHLMHNFAQKILQK